jgi:hypothetical protein
MRRDRPGSKGFLVYSSEPSTGERDEFDRQVVDIAAFETDLSPDDWATKHRGGRTRLWADLLGADPGASPTITVGRGRTNLTLITPTIVQTDAATRYAGFYRRESPNRNPVVAVHFHPGAYGIAGTGTYVFTFALDAPARATFSPAGYACTGSVDAPGSISFSGRRVITVILRNVPANQEAYASIEQTAGESWSWYSTRISHPPLVLEIASP